MSDGFGSIFALVIVLFVLLIIIGCACVRPPAPVLPARRCPLC
ncbi:MULTISPECIES: YjcZ family sporulation protein [Bacillaceae]|nr:MULTISPECIES: YjcZ family sporulation protein [Bacillaceae]MDX8360478.1 YjcZ family sporulation protein [Cytobacillus sp. IB215316]MDX8365781.1 YjcZ family sporulation protein [Cytobacillus sp. IB215665]